MEENFQFNLVDGLFTSEEAARVLFPLLQHKINFHSLEQFSSEIRNDEDSFNSKKRISELQQAQAKLIEVLNEIRKSNKKIQVIGEIKIHAI